MLCKCCEDVGSDESELCVEEKAVKMIEVAWRRNKVVEEKWYEEFSVEKRMLWSPRRGAMDALRREHGGAGPRCRDGMV